MLNSKNQKVDISSLNEAERALFAKYGKLPLNKNTKLTERKYFDSGDYALSKAGVSPAHTVGTAIPSPSDIPHCTPSNSSASSIGIVSTSPTSSSFMAGATQFGTSPGKEGMVATGRGENMTFSSSDV